MDPVGVAVSLRHTGVARGQIRARDKEGCSVEYLPPLRAASILCYRSTTGFGLGKRQRQRDGSTNGRYKPNNLSLPSCNAE